ncbi:ATP-binding protein [Streptomyces sp. SP18BB07]|uniref:ATP-binding protein n=1 Tax=Streptomyces sp. SP18BB07 TaxID=3002522 RepID=UPI002E768083|nr:ATP-binding protein [Streptomyces sp. SP18BB07]MEE1764265.1 ATP-binding protein [Streptomyces sp. SP18BB07]
MKRQARGGGPTAIGASSAETEGAVGEAADKAGADQLRHRLGRADLRAVPEARRALRELLRQWGRPGRSEIAELLTSELVTNAIIHTDHDAVLTATVSPRGLHVEVRDFVGRRPRPRVQPADDSTNGRGLLLVQSLADAWGVRAHGVGKAVWFDLDGGLT